MRFLTAFASTAALAVFTIAGVCAQAKPDFSGTWTLDPPSAAAAQAARVTPPRQLTLTQDADTLTMSWTQAGKTISETLDLDGSESKTQMSGITKATWDGNRIVVVTRQTFGGKEIEERRVLSLDGGDLVFEMTLPNTGDGDPAVVRIVFKKA